MTGEDIERSRARIDHALRDGFLHESQEAEIYAAFDAVALLASRPETSA